MLKKKRNKRKISLLITMIDFIIIVIVIMYINTVLFKVKTVSVQDYKIKYKYDILKEKMGYIFSLKIENTGKNKKVLSMDNNALFYIQEKKGERIVWEKEMNKPSFPMNLEGQKEVELEPEGVLSYSYIYDIQNQPMLPAGNYLLGAKVEIGTNNIDINILRTQKSKKKKFFDFFD